MGSKVEDEHRLGPWILEEEIGAGGLSDVWRAHHSQDGRIAALKILREPERSEAHTRRFLREGLLLGRLEHPSLPRCPSASEEPAPHLVLELLEGETLSEHLRNHGPMEPERASLVMESLLKVLHYLHQHGIIHRDVKPSNVYIARDRRVLLLDLGLAVDPEDPLTTTLGDVMGTYAYMAPEQIAGAEVDHRCDLYSLGVTLYEALSGTRPFRADDAAGYLEAHRSGLRTPLPEMAPNAPIRLLDTISRLMSRDPIARPESASIARALLTGSSGTSRELRKPSLLGRMAPIGAIEAALDGTGAISIVGEMGSGMGRMANEALQRARSQQYEIIAIRCNSLGSPMDPVEQLLRDLRRILDDVDHSTSEICRAVEGLSGEGPLLLLIESIEHCSDMAEKVFAEVLAAAPQLTLITVGTRAPNHIQTHVVQLRPLKISEVQRLLVSVLGTPSPPARLAAQLRRISSGQPAIIVMALKDLVNRGALTCTGIGADGMIEWKLDRHAPLEPTQGLNRLFSGLVESLSESAMSILRVMAVIGEALPTPILLTLAGTDPSGYDLGPLRLAKLLAESEHSGETWLTLRRPAIASFLLKDLTESEQRDVHRRLVDLLEAHPHSAWRNERIAWHRAHSATSEKTPVALLELGEELLSKGRAEQALSVLNRATSLNPSDTRISARLALARGEGLDRLSRPEEALTALRAGRKLAEGLKDTHLQGRAMVVLGRVHHHLGDERRALALAEEAIELFESDRENPYLPVALHMASNSHRLAGRPERADAMARECLTTARTQGNREYIARAMGVMGILFAEEGHLDSALHHLQQEASWFRMNNRKETLVACLYRIAICHRRMGNPDLALEALDEADSLTRFGGMGYYRALVLIGRAAIHLTLGDIAGANDMLESAREARDASAPTWIRINWQETQAQLRLIAGDIQAALAVYHAAEMEAGRAGYIVTASFFLGMTGVITADPRAITDAMEVLNCAGDRTMGARLLLHGATVGGDDEVLESAMEEVRASGDQFLLLKVLLASAGAHHQREALEIATAISEKVPNQLLEGYLDQPMIRWTGLRSMIRARRG